MFNSLQYTFPFHYQGSYSFVQHSRVNRKISDLHGDDCEECHLLGCYAV
jgi:hypothetical protein